jgi:hypothetical protein
VDHLGFEVESRARLDELALHAEDGALLIAPPREAPAPVGYILKVRDPDGHVIEFTYGQPLVGL